MFKTKNATSLRLLVYEIHIYLALLYEILKKLIGFEANLRIEDSDRGSDGNFPLEFKAWVSNPTEVIQQCHHF